MQVKRYESPSLLVQGLFEEAQERRVEKDGAQFSRLELMTIDALVRFLEEAETCGHTQPADIIHEMDQQGSSLHQTFVRLMEYR